MDADRTNTFRSVGLGCVVLAVILFLLGLNGIVRGPGADYYAGTGVLHAVGAFVPAAVALVAGLWMILAHPRPR